ncbi:MAG: hypothetical protein MZW92_57545 [Comamonadaceae bacterium]|nr:hypothetical protein [Comamonadaceae bacterium]
MCIGVPMQVRRACRPERGAGGRPRRAPRASTPRWSARSRARRLAARLPRAARASALDAARAAEIDATLDLLAAALAGGDAAAAEPASRCRRRLTRAPNWPTLRRRSCHSSRAPETTLRDDALHPPTAPAPLVDAPRRAPRRDGSTPTDVDDCVAGARRPRAVLPRRPGALSRRRSTSPSCCPSCSARVRRPLRRSASCRAADEDRWHARFGVQRWPSLVFLRGGRYVGDRRRHARLGRLPRRASPRRCVDAGRRARRRSAFPSPPPPAGGALSPTDAMRARR